ncbi:MAG: phosphopantetheine-binding protein [Paracoccaceae bacterium]
MSDQIFGAGINLSSIAFTEFVMDLEEECDIDIDIDDLDGSIKTVGQLYERVSTY